MPLKIRRNRAPAPPGGCPISECMAFLGGAWAPNVIWNLSAQPRRFSELKLDMPGISAKVLSSRLKELEEKGVVVRSVMPTSPPSVEYRLTALGQELVPAIQAIVAVGHKLKQTEAGNAGARSRKGRSGRKSVGR